MNDSTSNSVSSVYRRPAGRKRLPVVVAPVPGWVAADQPAHHREDRDGMRRGGRRGGDDHRVADLVRMLDGPFDRLLAAEAAADHRVQALDAEPGDQVVVG